MSTMDFIKEAEDSFEGFEEVTTQTMSIPFVKLAQQLTPHANKKKPEYIDGLEEGMFFMTPGDILLGEEFNFIILKFERVYIEWLADRGGFVGYHTPENAANIATDKTFGKWKTAEGNDLQEYYTYYGLIEGREHEGPVIMSLTSTAIKTAKDLNRIMTTHIMDDGNKAMPYYLVFTVEANHIEKGANDWYVPKFRFDHYINEKQYEIVTGDRKALPNQQVDFALIEDKSGSNSNKPTEDDF